MTSVMQNNPKKRNIFVIDFTKLCCEKLAIDMIKGNYFIAINVETGLAEVGDSKNRILAKFLLFSTLENKVEDACPYCFKSIDEIFVLERWNRSLINTDT